MCSYNTEPTIEELLTDPIARLLMARDGLLPEYVRACVGATRQKLKALEASERDVAGPRAYASTAIESE